MTHMWPRLICGVRPGRRDDIHDSYVAMTNMLICGVRPGRIHMIHVATGHKPHSRPLGHWARLCPPHTHTHITMWTMPPPTPSTPQPCGACPPPPPHTQPQPCGPPPPNTHPCGRTHPRPSCSTNLRPSCQRRPPQPPGQAGPRESRPTWQRTRQQKRWRRARQRGSGRARQPRRRQGQARLPLQLRGCPVLRGRRGRFTCVMMPPGPPGMRAELLLVAMYRQL